MKEVADLFAYKALYSVVKESSEVSAETRLKSLASAFERARNTYKPFSVGTDSFGALIERLESEDEDYDTIASIVDDIVDEMSVELNSAYDSIGKALESIKKQLN